MSVRIMGSRKKSRAVMTIALIVLGLAVLIMPVYGMYRFRIIQERHENEIRQMQDKLDEWQQKVEHVEKLKVSVYVPKNDISILTVIKEDMFSKVEIYSSLPHEYFMSEDDFGKMTAVRRPKGIPVMKDAQIEELIDPDVREEEFNMFLLPSNLKANEIVDVRITFPNGEDYIVLTKKKIHGLSLKRNTIWIWLNEKEIHRINSAIIDAYMNPGTKLYVLKYVQPQTQDGIIPTYVVNEHVMEVMQASPNIIELAREELAIQARKLMEERLSSLSAERVNAVASNILTEASTRRIQDSDDESPAELEDEDLETGLDWSIDGKDTGEETTSGKEADGPYGGFN